MVRSKFFTLAEVADQLGLSVQRIRQLVTSGRLRGERMGQVWMVRDSELARFAALERPAHRPAKGDRAR